jgi:hypothetical protein
VESWVLGTPKMWSIAVVGSWVCGLGGEVLERIGSRFGMEKCR